ncbi:MAG: ferrochelatase [Pusillimonas sp.]|jgi:ferrochelatase|nr:ferrochelatase [Pusillimonas sp.]
MPSLLPTRYQPEPEDPYGLDPQPPARELGPIGILVVNLGTPDEPSAAAIRRYLAEFLSDPRVIEIPLWAWQIILHGIILRTRPRKLVPRYQGIWLEQGSPLVVYSKAQARGLETQLRSEGENIRVELAMRYGNPSIQAGLDALRKQGCERILTVPLYPQYAASTTATVVDAVTGYAARLRNQPELRFIKRYHDDPGYIESLVRKLTDFWSENGKPERLLLSFHGLPQRTILQGDPYHRDCMDTVRAIKALLPPEDAQRVYVSFQSRFGAEKWLQPYTEPTLQSWAAEGVKRVDVMCPGFLADCLETLEEIQEECREAFLHAGGETFRYIPCLNDDPQWVQALTSIVRRQLVGWSGTA